MALIGALEPFNSTRDDFEIWTLAYDAILVANEIDANKEVDRARAILLNFLGLPTLTLLRNLIAPTAVTAKSPQDLLKVLKSHFAPTPKAIAERYKFMGRRQAPGESISNFVAELRKLATHCQFGSGLDNRLRDQFIFGISCEATQRVLFTKDDTISLKEVLEIAEAAALAAASTSLIRGQNSYLSGDPEQSVHKVGFQKSQGEGSASSTRSRGKDCGRCGSFKHLARDCPNMDKVCNKCGKKGHFYSKCRTKDSNIVEVDMDSIHELNCVTSQVPNHKKVITVSVLVNGKPHDMELDTGCESSIISETFWKNDLQAPVLRKSKIKFRTYTKELFSPLGELESEINYAGQIVKICIPVVKGASLFGRDLLNAIKLDWTSVQRQCNRVNADNSGDEQLKLLLNEFSDVFDEPTMKNKIRNFKARVILKEDAVPRRLKARPLPFAVREKVERELELMVKQGVIEKVDYSEWASPLVVVPKSNGRVRITGDFKNTVNNQLCVTQYPLAVPEDLYATVSGGVKFSKLDGSNAYHQIELEEECKKFLVINTHKGLFRYNVLPQGIASSPAIFQEFMDKMIQGINKTGAFIDDLLTTGVTDEQHLATLRKILERMRIYNYKLSPEKCEFMKNEVEFLGHLVNVYGIQTTKAKVNDILKMKPPKDVSSLRSFMGLVNFYGKFVPKLADICGPLYNLTKAEVIWNWTKECRNAVQEVKSKLSTAPTLVHFDPKKYIGISCDASSKGLGVVLFHKLNDGTEHPIAYASKVLSPTEQRYSQIEKEGLSIIFGIKKYYKYLCGRKFLLVTDHKPLLSIFGPKTQLPTYVASRLHHWCVYLSQFQFDVIYRKSNEHGNADALSRMVEIHNISTETLGDESGAGLSIDEERGLDSGEREMERAINRVILDQFDVLPVTWKEIKNKSSRDKTISKIIRFVEGGWPHRLSEEDAHLQPYFIKREELMITNGIVMWGIRVIVPHELQLIMLNQLHENHFGIVRMKSIARQYIWWPSIDGQIEELCRSCSECQVTKPDPAVAPLHPWCYPERAWQRLHIDLAGPFLEKMWLIVIDAHSKWPEVYNMHNDTTSAAIKIKLADAFSRFGLPDQIVSDNGVQFTSDEFAKFCKANGIRHTRASVYHPRSNGEAERFVRTFKDVMKLGKVKPEGRLAQFLLQYRSTNHATTGTSPAELLLGRKLKTSMDLIRPNTQAEVFKSQSRQQENFNARKALRQFTQHDDVWVKTFSRNEEKWSKGKVIKLLGPVTYLIQVGGKELKRHVDHIRKASLEVPDIHVSPPSMPNQATPVHSPQRSDQGQPGSPAASPPRSASATPSTLPCTPVGNRISPSISSGDPVHYPSAAAINDRPRRTMRKPDYYKC